MKCPKCGYERKAKESVPATQCPSCGIYYAKFAGPMPPPTRATYVPAPEPQGTGFIGKLLFAGVLVAGIAYVAASMPAGLWMRLLPGAQAGKNYELPGPGGRGKLRDVDFSRSRIVMYSLTTCIYCAELRHIFEANKVPFTEYFIDTDQARYREMFGKLQAMGFGGGVGTPTLEVNGRMMPNNPPIEDIIKQAL